MKIKCDFCGAPPRWTYPADDFEITLPDIGPTGHASRSSWAACDRCHALIEANDRAGLARRASDQIEAVENPPREMLDFVRQHMRALHDQFFTHRTGPGGPLGVV